MSDTFTPFIPSQTPKIRYGCHSDTDQKLNVGAYPTWGLQQVFFNHMVSPSSKSLHLEPLVKYPKFQPKIPKWVIEAN